MASAPTSSPKPASIPPPPSAPKKRWTMPSLSINLPSRANLMTAIAIATAGAAGVEGVMNHDASVKQAYAEYGTAETAKCVGTGLKSATEKGGTADPGAICGDCRTSIAKSLDTYVPWAVVNQTYTRPDQDLIQAEVRRGANLVCKGLGTKESK